MFKVGLDRYLRFFTIEEQEYKLNFINLIYVSNGHAGRDRLYNLLSTKAYGLVRKEVLDVIKSCEICQVRRTMVTRPIVRPIVAHHTRERYLANLIDFRCYSEVNVGYK